MNLILFIVALIVSFVAVRVGAIAFQLTGLEWSLAKFQALSCFSGTGFTTREAELIVGHPQRRKIASILMVLGNAGLVTMVATFANSIRPRIVSSAASWSTLWGLRPYINLAVIAISIYAIYRVLTKSSFGKRVTDYLRIKVEHSDIVEPVSFEELTVTTGGYGVVRTDIVHNSPFINKSLEKSGLRDRDVTVLAVRRAGETTPNPKGGTTIEINDQLLCFGRLDQMKEIFQTDTLIEKTQLPPNDFKSDGSSSC
jgi:hypothetical protein